MICSEVLEHIPDWPAAVANLARMARRYVLITVPTGKVRAMDRMVGHTQHFAGPELVAALGRGRLLAARRCGAGGSPSTRSTASPISAQAERVYDAFGGGDAYGPGRSSSPRPSTASSSPTTSSAPATS